MDPILVFILQNRNTCEEWLNGSPKATDLFEALLLKPGSDPYSVLCYITIPCNLQNLNFDSSKGYSAWVGEKMGGGHCYKHQLLLKST